jgi:hypothetical protein
MITSVSTELVNDPQINLPGYFALVFDRYLEAKGLRAVTPVQVEQSDAVDVCAELCGRPAMRPDMTAFRLSADVEPVEGQ